MKGGKSSSSDPQSAAPRRNGEYLSFSLGGEEYCIEVAKVQEVRGYEQPTAVANVPEFIKGVLSVHNVMVPIVDMRIKFKSGDARYDELTAVIMLIAGGRLLGMVVDGVADVIELTAKKIDPAPRSSAPIPAEYLSGQTEIGRRRLKLLDVEKLMTSKDMALMQLMR